MVLASSTGETVAEFAEEGDDMDRSRVVAILLMCISGCILYFIVLIKKIKLLQLKTEIRYQSI